MNPWDSATISTCELISPSCDPPDGWEDAARICDLEQQVKALKHLCDSTKDERDKLREELKCLSVADYQDYQALAEYFRNENPDAGRRGDDADYTTAFCAIVEMRSMIATIQSLRGANESLKQDNANYSKCLAEHAELLFTNAGLKAENRDLRSRLNGDDEGEYQTLSRKQLWGKVEIAERDYAECLVVCNELRDRNKELREDNAVLAEIRKALDGVDVNEFDFLPVERQVADLVEMWKNQCHSILLMDQSSSKAFDAIPRTADGVPVLPGMRLWTTVMHHGIVPLEVESLNDLKSDWPAIIRADFDNFGHAGTYRWHVQSCYSTKEAAEKANENKSA